MRAAHDVGQLQILQNVGPCAHDVVAMGRAVVHVVVENGAALVGIGQELPDLLAHNGVDGIERTEEHHVVGVDLRALKVELVTVVVFVEHVLGIVLVVEKSQRQGRALSAMNAHAARRHAVFLEETGDAAAHPVVACLADKLCRHARASQRNDAVVDRTARHSAHGLIAAEDDVEHGLAYSYYFPHGSSSFSPCFTMSLCSLKME